MPPLDVLSLSDVPSSKWRHQSLPQESALHVSPRSSSLLQTVAEAEDVTVVKRRLRSQTQRLGMKFHEDARRHSGASIRGAHRRFSITALWSITNEHDLEVDDELTRSQKVLKDLKSRISSQSKRNYLLEKDVRYLDGRIALLIQNRMALDEEMANHFGGGDDNAMESSDVAAFPDDRRRQLYGNLFFLLQTEPRIVAHLARLVTISEMDNLLQTVMFTLYGNQYDNREEHLLLTMFQSVLKEQFDSATDFGSLLRANTPVSRMMTTYIRRGPGQQYLKLVLSENLNRLLAKGELNFEINPLKVYEQMINEIETETGKDCDLPRNVSDDVAASNNRVRAIIAPRVQTLVEVANSFLDTIVDSLDQVPYGIRWICKQIMLLTKVCNFD
jgi:Ras GTPase-activating-like protein IQGAP2/3